MGTKFAIIFSIMYLAALPVRAAELAQAPGAEVEGLLALVRQHNAELAGAGHEADAVAQRTAAAGALPDPAFRISLQDFTNKMSGAAPSLLPSQVGSTYYRVMQPLPVWGKRDLKRDIAEAEANQAQGRKNTTWAELAARVKTDFAQYYVLSRSRQLMQEMLDLTLNLERIAKSRYATGLAPQQDVIRAQVEQTGLRRDLVQLETERHHSMTRINNLLLREPHAPLAEPQHLRALPDAAKLEYAALAERLKTGNPQLYTLDAQIVAADKGRSLALKNRYPDFTLGLGSMQSGNEITAWELMLEFNIPLQQGVRRSQEREADSMLAAAQARREAAASELMGGLADTVSALAAARRIETLTSGSLLPQAEATLQAAYVGYQNGKVDFATLLDAQRQIIRARMDVLNAQMQTQTSLAQIEKLLGEEL